MMHFSCDLCGKEIRSGEDTRYVVKIDVFPAQDPAELTEADLDQDHLEEVGQMLNEMADKQELSLPPPVRHFRFDLCCECHRKFQRDPLGKELQQKLFFSKN